MHIVLVSLEFIGPAFIIILSSYLEQPEAPLWKGIAIVMYFALLK